MARQIRINYPNAYYHVMNRGSGRMDIAHNECDFRLFKKTLSEMRLRYGVQIHSFCLMTNHYHLLVRTPNANLSQAMKYFGQYYTQKFNQMHARDGHLFRGRYHAMIVEDEVYLRQLVRYIHLNPVKALISKRPEEYPWSSYQCLVKEELAFDYLDSELTLNWFGESIEGAKDSLKAFIDEGNLPSLEHLFGRKRLPMILSSDSIARTLENLIDLKRDSPE